MDKTKLLFVKAFVPCFKAPSYELELIGRSCLSIMFMRVRENPKLYWSRIKQEDNSYAYRPTQLFS